MKWKIFLVIGVGVVLLSVVLIGCSGSNGEQRASDWVGLTGDQIKGSSANVMLFVSGKSVKTGQSLPVAVLVLDQHGTSVIDGTKVQFFSQLGGKFGDAELSATSGWCQANYAAGTTPGTDVITALALGVTATATVWVVPQAVPVLKVRVTTAVDQVRPSETSPVAVFVADEGGAAVKTTVRMHSANGGAFNPAEGESTDGFFTTMFTASSTVGVETITAMAMGTTGSTTLSVYP